MILCKHEYENQFYAIRTCTWKEEKVGRWYSFREDQTWSDLGVWQCIASVKMSEMDTLLELTDGQERVYLGCFK